MGFLSSARVSNADPTGLHWRNRASTSRSLQSLLESQKVAPFESQGQTFDPSLHEAIGSDQTGVHETGTVTQELRRGYRLGDELLRPARVRVAQ